VRALAIAVGAAVLLAFAAVVWVDSLFREPDARKIESLTGALGARTLLAVFAHPDDEISAAGALADAASNGVRVYVVTATRGEKGKADFSVSSSDELARIREAELRAHTRALGVTEQQVWHFPDSQVDRDIPALSQRIAAEIERIAPDAILSFHPESGLTYHRDHRAVGEATVRAIAATGSPARLVQLLVPAAMMRTFAGERGALVAKNQPPATWAMPIDSRIKRRAWTIHASQAGFIRRVYKVSPWVLYFFFDEEHYFVPEPRR